MNLPIQRYAGITLLATVLLAPPASANDPSSSALPPSPEQLQEQLRQQQERIQELERLVKQQAAVLESLRQQFVSQQAQPPAATTSPQAATEQLANRVNNLEKKTDEAGKNVSNKLKQLGNFTFSGDVRVRYEPFFGGGLPSSPTPPARNRERFRVRLNVNAKFSDELSGGLTIASGDATDPISTNQTFTSFFQRKFIGIDKAFVQYNPKWFKPLTLTGGKYAYTWYRTELTWDNDLNPEGFSQVLTFNFKNPVFQKLVLVGFQNPVVEIGNRDDSFVHGGQVQTYWKLGDRAKFSGYVAFYNFHRADPIRAAQSSGTLTGSTNTNAATASQFASRFGILDLIGRVDINTCYARWPLMLQLDFANNTRACTNLPAIVGAKPACNPHDRSGYWAEVQVGKTQEKGDVRLGYTFIRVEREAVLAAFNFSDLRQPTNVFNHRLEFFYQAYNNITLGFTGLIGRPLVTATSPQERLLKRLQFDVLYKF